MQSVMPSSSDSDGNKSWSMLLAEDNDSHAKLIKRAALNVYHALEIIHLMDGAEVLGYLRDKQERNEILPHFLLLDLRLPKVDGMEVLRTIKSDQYLKKLPVVVFSSSENEDEIHEAYELGANSYLIKPIDYEKLKQLIQEISVYWFNYNRAP